MIRRHDMAARGMGHLDMDYPLLAALLLQGLLLDTWPREDEATTTPPRMNTATVHGPKPAPVCYDLRL